MKSEQQKGEKKLRSILHIVNEIQKLTGEFFEIETMLPFCHHTKTLCTPFEQIAYIETCVSRKLLANWFDRSSIFSPPTRREFKIEAKNFQLVDSFKKVFKWISKCCCRTSNVPLVFKLIRNWQYTHTHTASESLIKQCCGIVWLKLKAQNVNRTMWF